MNNTRKRSSMMVRLVAVLAVIMMFTMCFVGGTFAKYTSSGSGSDDARVAKWSFKVGGTDGTDIAPSTTNLFTFDLFKTVNDTNGALEEDINPADGTIIAPGTQGSFELILKNESEVAAQYAIDYTVTKNGIPVQFSVDGNTWTDDLDDVVASSDTKLAAGGAEKRINIQWRWVFERYTVVNTAEVGTPVAGTQYYTQDPEGNYVPATISDNQFARDTTYYTIEDAADTTLGVAGTAQVTVEAKVTATQVD